MMKTLENLGRLVAFPTVSAVSNLKIIDYIQDFLNTRGFETHRVADQTGLKAGLFARIGPSDKAGIMLSGHTDVVPITGQTWTTDPFKMTVADGKAYGRGTTDMKGYLACMLTLADKASQIKLREPLKLAFSYDEEVGCVGIRAMIDQLDKTIGLPRFCFVGEPTSMQVATGHKGKVALRAICHGAGGHSAMAPKLLNALHLATDFVNSIRELQDDYSQNGNQDNYYYVPFTTLHIAKISGGTALNIVPDKSEVDFEFRHLSTDDPMSIISQLKTIAQKVSKLHQTQFLCANIEVQQMNSYPALDTNICNSIVSYAKNLAQVSDTTKVDFGTEGGYFSTRLGLPTIICGPGSMQDQGHKPDEHITLTQLHACDHMFERLLCDIKTKQDNRGA